MRRFTLIGILVVAALLPAVAHAWPGDRPARHPLEGAWRLVGTLAEDDDVVVPNAPGFDEYKVVADGYFMWTSLQDGKIVRHAGGMARMGRATYVERVDYTDAPELGWMVGHRLKFRWKLVDGLWYHTGTLRTDGAMTARVAEVWERVK